MKINLLNFWKYHRTLLGVQDPSDPASAVPVSREAPLPIRDVGDVDMPVLGDESVAVGAAAVGVAVPAGATHGVSEGQLAALRYRVSGQAPTATVGYDLPAGDRELLTRSELLGMRLIRAGATDGRVMVTYYRERA